MNSNDDRTNEKDKQNKELSISANKNNIFVADQQQDIQGKVQQFVQINNDLLLSSRFIDLSSSSSSSSSVSSYLMMNDISQGENIKAGVHQAIGKDEKVFHNSQRTMSVKGVGKIIFESECQKKISVDIGQNDNMMTEVPDEAVEDDEDGLLVVLADDDRAAETANILLSEDVQPIATLDCCRSGFDDYEEFNMCLNQMLHDDEANGLSPSAVIADTISMDVLEQQSSIYQQQQRQQRELIENLMLEYEDEKKYQKQISKPEQEILKDDMKYVKGKRIESVVDTKSSQATIPRNITIPSLTSVTDIAKLGTNRNKDKEGEQVQLKSIDRNAPKGT